MQPTKDQLSRAASKWQGSRSNPCCEDESPYFYFNWDALPGLRKFVEAEVAADLQKPQESN